MNQPAVRLMHYDPRWRQEFRQTKSSLLQSCMGWVTAVEHVGSTAIEGLIAQPIIDVFAVVNVNASENPEDNPFGRASDLIEGLNFAKSDLPNWALTKGGENQVVVVLEKPRHRNPTHRVFLVQDTWKVWQQAIGIRDRLRADRDLAFRFEETKVARWRSGDGDPSKYESDKSIFFTHLIDQIDSHPI